MSGISGISSTSPYLFGHIASGKSIMSAADGAAQLAISEKMNAQITGYNTGTKNLGDGLSLLKTSDSALGSVTNYLQRIRELALRSTNSTLNSTNRASIQNEIDQLKQGIEQVASQTNFNGMNLLDGSLNNGVQLVSNAENGSINVNSSVNSTLQALGIADFDITKNFDIGTIDNALDMINSSRGTLGAQYNRVEYAIDFNGYASSNLTASMSRISDSDIAEMITELKHQQTLQSVSMMLQKKNMSQQGQKASSLLAGL